MTSGGSVQEFSIPAQATRFFLGAMDGYEWSNNSGTITADVTQIVPEPEIYTMLFAGLGLSASPAAMRVA
ncbi:MAG TPA: hypothetical protein VJ734_09025 [Nitrosospira sp.]|nr:hypothetical protein [Nitrosospira sp.]